MNKKKIFFYIYISIFFDFFFSNKNIKYPSNKIPLKISSRTKTIIESNQKLKCAKIIIPIEKPIKEKQKFYRNIYNIGGVSSILILYFGYKKYVKYREKKFFLKQFPMAKSLIEKKISDGQQKDYSESIKTMFSKKIKDENGRENLNPEHFAQKLKESFVEWPFLKLSNNDREQENVEINTAAYVMKSRIKKFMDYFCFPGLRNILHLSLNPIKSTTYHEKAILESIPRILINDYENNISFSDANVSLLNELINCIAPVIALMQNCSLIFGTNGVKELFILEYLDWNKIINNEKQDLWDGIERYISGIKEYVLPLDQYDDPTGDVECLQTLFVSKFLNECLIIIDNVYDKFEEKTSISISSQDKKNIYHHLILQNTQLLQKLHGGMESKTIAT